MAKVSFNVHVQDSQPQKWRVVKISSATLISSYARVDLYRQIGERIAYTRKARGLSQPELGQLVGISGNKIQNIEICRFNIRLSLSLLHAISSALNTPLSSLLPSTSDLELAREPIAINSDESGEELALLHAHWRSFYNQQVGRNVFSCRTQKGLSVQDLSEKIGYPACTVVKNGRSLPQHVRGLITRIEKGEAAPDVFLLLAIANALECAIEDLIPAIEIDYLGGIVDILFRNDRRGALSPNALLFRDLFQQGYGDKIIELISQQLDALEEDEAVVMRSSFLMECLNSSAATHPGAIA